MNDPLFLGVTIVLLSIILFMTSPLRYRHWVVFAFVLLSFIIALIGLSAKFLFIAVLAALLWFAGQMVDWWA
jgi:hypothetical protein